MQQRIAAANDSHYSISQSRFVRKSIFVYAHKSAVDVKKIFSKHWILKLAHSLYILAVITGLQGLESAQNMIPDKRKRRIHNTENIQVNQMKQETKANLDVNKSVANKYFTRKKIRSEIIEEENVFYDCS